MVRHYPVPVAENCRDLLNRSDLDPDVNLRRPAARRLRMTDQHDVGGRLPKRNLGFVLVTGHGRWCRALAGKIDGDLILGEPYLTVTIETERSFDYRSDNRA
jgi:hypothetical protein